MANDLTLKTDAPPTYWNKEALIGTLLLPIIGTVIGAVVGKNRMEREARAGKQVTDQPSFWNKDTLLGALVGHIVGVIAARGMLAGLIGMASTATPAALLAVAAPALLVSAGCIAVGTYVGGKAGQTHEVGEYEQAKQQTIVRHLSATVSPEVGKAVENSLANDKSWTKDMIEERMLAAAQHRQV